MKTGRSERFWVQLRVKAAKRTKLAWHPSGRSEELPARQEGVLAWGEADYNGANALAFHLLQRYCVNTPLQGS